MYILANYFLVNDQPGLSDGFITLYNVAFDVVNATCSEVALVHEEMRDLPLFIQSGVMLAALAILKIHRSELSGVINLEAGEKAYFSAIIAKRDHILQNDDLSSRSATILSQLWNSQTIFKTQSGISNTLRSRVRSRLSMSIMFDCFWWWRQEFGGQTNPFADQSGRQSECWQPWKISLVQRMLSNWFSSSSDLSCGY